MARGATPSEASSRSEHEHAALDLYMALLECMYIDRYMCIYMCVYITKTGKNKARRRVYETMALHIQISLLSLKVHTVHTQTRERHTTSHDTRVSHSTERAHREREIDDVCGPTV